MWTCKVLLETTHRLHYRRRLREAQATANALKCQQDNTLTTDSPLSTTLVVSTTDIPQSPAASPTANDPSPPTNLRRSRFPSTRYSTPPLKRRRGSTIITPITAPAQPAPHGAFIFPTISQSHRRDLQRAIRTGDHVALRLYHPIFPDKRLTITGTSLDRLQKAEMSENSSIDALFTLGIPTNLAPAIQWAHTDFFYSLALTGLGYDSTVAPRCRSHIDFFRPDAILTLIPIYQDFHFTLIVIDHIRRQIKGYDSLYGNPDGDNKMITNLLSGKIGCGSWRTG
jgi:hypothetical protein